MRVGYVEVVVVLLYEIVSINVHLMLDAFFVPFDLIFVYYASTHGTFSFQFISVFLFLCCLFLFSLMILYGMLS